MAHLYHNNTGYQKRLTPILKRLRKIGVTPNQLTLAAVVLSCLTGASILLYEYNSAAILIVPVGYLVRVMLNALNEMMSTQYKMQSKLGELLNEVGDVVSDLAIFLPFMQLPFLNTYVVVVFAVISVVNEYTGMLGKALGGIRRYEGPMSKTDRAFAISLFCIALYVFPNVAAYGNWVFGVLIYLVGFSTSIRIRKAIA